MLDIAEELSRWLDEGRDFAVATVVAVSGSAPGAALAVDADGTVIGSVSGGCVEGAVYDLCAQALQDGQVVRERFGYSDEEAFPTSALPKCLDTGVLSRELEAVPLIRGIQRAVSSC